MEGKSLATYTIVQEETEYGIEYGISCEESGYSYLAINKISPNKSFVEDMVEKFNEYQLASSQFYDEVEDFLP